jgi:hypothetical protein
LVEGHAIAEVTRYQLLTKMIWVQSQVTSSKIHGASGTGEGHSCWFKKCFDTVVAILVFRFIQQN